MLSRCTCRVWFWRELPMHAHAIPSNTDSGEQHPPGPAPNLHFQCKFVGAWLSVEVVGWSLNDGVMFTSCANATVAVRWLGLPLLWNSVNLGLGSRLDWIDWGLSIVCSDLRSSCYCSSSSPGTFIVSWGNFQKTFRVMKPSHIGKVIFGFIPSAIVIVFPFHRRHSFQMHLDWLAGEFNVRLHSFC